MHPFLHTFLPHWYSFSEWNDTLAPQHLATHPAASTSHTPYTSFVSFLGGGGGGGGHPSSASAVGGGNTSTGWLGALSGESSGDGGERGKAFGVGASSTSTPPPLVHKSNLQPSSLPQPHSSKYGASPMSTSRAPSSSLSALSGAGSVDLKTQHHVKPPIADWANSAGTFAVSRVSVSGCPCLCLCLCLLFILCLNLYLCLNLCLCLCLCIV